MDRDQEKGLNISKHFDIKLKDNEISPKESLYNNNKHHVRRLVGYSSWNIGKRKTSLVDYDQKMFR